MFQLWNAINQYFVIFITVLIMVSAVYSQTGNEYLSKGFAKYILQDYIGAIADYNKAIELNPKDAVAFCKRGIAQYCLKDYASAISDYTKAIEINPKDANTYYNRGTAKYEIKDYTGAIADHTIAIKYNPNYAFAYYNRGLAQSSLKDYASAISDYTKAIEINPKDADAKLNLEYAQIKLTDYTNKAINSITKDAKAHYNRDTAYSGETISSVTELKQQIQKLKAENDALKQENQVLRKLLFEKQNPVQTIPQPQPTAASTSRVPATSVQQPASGPSVVKGYWMTSSSGKRHNSSCRYYGTSRGRSCGPNDGIPCKICGG